METGLTHHEQATALAKTPRNIRDLLAGPEISAQIGKVLGSRARAERFCRVALNATMRKPELLQCTKESFFLSLLDLSSYGLEPDDRLAHLIPFKNTKQRTYECTLIVNYRGLAYCVRRSGEVIAIHADWVIPEDEFSFSYGSTGSLIHKPNMAARSVFSALPLIQKKQRIRAFYSYVRLKDGSEDFLVWSIGEVEKIRRRSKSGETGPWAHADDYLEMGKKSVFRNQAKWLPFSSETRDMIERDDDAIDVNAGTVLDQAEQILGSPDKSIKATESKAESAEEQPQEPEPVGEAQTPADK